MREVDIICPVYWVDWKFFSSNIDSWLKELNVRKIYMGVNNPDPELYEMLAQYQQKYPKLQLFDQRHHKTLGKCLVELMSYVETEWFAYVHSDVELTDRCAYIMETYQGDATGIIESERLHYDGIKYTYDPYYFTSRAYSGFQLIRKAAIESMINRIEDDYLYRNEDIIFQNACINNEYFYVKTLALHIHQLTTTKKWTFDRKSTYDMQWKGLVKYCTPTDITIQASVDAIGVLIREFDFDLHDMLEEIDNQDWKKAIINKLIK